MNKSIKFTIIFATIASIILGAVSFLKYSDQILIPNITDRIPDIIYPSKRIIPLHLRGYQVVGIDVSHYQGMINWDQVEMMDDKAISFVFIRATQGDDGLDKYFKYNWKKAKEKGIVRGAYHYYRPNENSTKQAERFIRRVEIEDGDLPPVLDIEKFSRIQSNESLRKGLKNWLDLVEAHYGVRPIIYSGASHYQDLLQHELFEDYIFWIANYNKVDRPLRSEKRWTFWQFSDKGKINGIEGDTDLNVFKGGLSDFEALRFRKPVSTI
jgi:lysozyme